MPRRGDVAALAVALALTARVVAADALAPDPAPASGLRHGDALAGFTGKLRDLAEGRRDRVTIVHLGDSHVQGELLTGPLRRALQARFGTAGRGLVMPLDAAGTNGPTDLLSVSDAEWNLSRVPAPDPAVPHGAAGLTTWTADGGFALKIGVRGTATDDAFDRVTVLTECGPAWTTIRLATHPSPLILESSRPISRDVRHTVRRGDTLYGLGRRWGSTVEQIRKWNRLPSALIHPGKSLIVRRVTGRRAPVDRTGFVTVGRFEPPSGPGPFAASVDLPTPVGHVFLCGSGTATGSARLYGILLDRRGARGIVYHTAGVNGAEVRDFGAADLFWKQLPLLTPDLLIVTLGTNDSLEAPFNPGAFETELGRFFDRTTAALPGTPVLLLGPPDRRGPRGRPAPAVGLVRDALGHAARTRGAAFWDAAEAMGGDGSILTWQKHGWAAPDLVHLTPEGYRRLAERLLGDLLAAPAATDAGAGGTRAPG